MDKCEEVQSLLPWLLNGTLMSLEKTEAYRHLTSCGTCRDELVFLQAMQKMLVQGDLRGVIEQGQKLGVITQETTPTSLDESALLSSILQQIEQMEQLEKVQTKRPLLQTMLPTTWMQMVTQGLRNIYDRELEKVEKGIQPAVDELQMVTSLMQQVVFPR